MTAMQAFARFLYLVASEAYHEAAVTAYNNKEYNTHLDHIEEGHQKVYAYNNYGRCWDCQHEECCC